MRTVAHLSDLHFGRDDPRAVEALRTDLVAASPDLVVVSGDLTQRARPREFRAARAFLAGLGAPVLAVPGNHDVPLYDVLLRFLTPLSRWHRHFAQPPEPAFEDDEVVLAGVSTARSNVWKEGRISLEQIARVQALFRASPGKLKVLVAHHPFAPPEDLPRASIVGRSRIALDALAREGLDLVLTGHLHHGHLRDLRDHFQSLGRSILTAQASTAVSMRRRGEPNAYNLLALGRDGIALEVRGLGEGAFSSLGRMVFVRGVDGWREEPAPSDAAHPSS
jgi:3',5'-cyclic AMP phosphodiesterase CpdA